MKSLVDGLEEFLVTPGPVFGQLVNAQFYDILNHHPDQIIGPYHTDHFPGERGNEPSEARHQDGENLGPHDCPEKLENVRRQPCKKGRRARRAGQDAADRCRTGKTLSDRVCPFARLCDRLFRRRRTSRRR